VKLALALGGGAGLGWAHIGVLRELIARGVTIDAVATASIGAVAAVCLAADRLGVLEDLARARPAGGR
jgi:NTE family protein